MGPMRQAKKDTQTSVEADDVFTDRKRKQGTRTRSLEMGSDDEGVLANEDESPNCSDGSPILSAQTRRAGNLNAYSKPIQKTSNADRRESPIIGKIILSIIFSRNLSHL